MIFRRRVVLSRNSLRGLDPSMIAIGACVGLLLVSFCTWMGGLHSTPQTKSSPVPIGHPGLSTALLSASLGTFKRCPIKQSPSDAWGFSKLYWKEIYSPQTVHLLEQTYHSSQHNLGIIVGACQHSQIHASNYQYHMTLSYKLTCMHVCTASTIPCSKSYKTNTCIQVPNWFEPVIYT